MVALISQFLNEVSFSGTMPDQEIWFILKRTDTTFTQNDHNSFTINTQNQMLTGQKLEF